MNSAASLIPIECPNPLRSLVAGHAGFAIVADEIHHLGLAPRGDLGGQFARVGDDENLGVVRDLRDELTKFHGSIHYYRHSHPS